jgi:hypothetical protein
MIQRLTLPYSIVLTSLLLLGSLSASRTQSIVHEGPSAFQTGELEDVSLNSDGILRFAPAVEVFARIPAPIVWTSLVTPEGDLILGTGNNGAVIQVSARGEVTTLFEPREVMTRALARSEDGTLYVGTSPTGRIYRIRPGQRAEVYFDPPAIYIWDMLIDPEGHLLVATGQPGRIFRLPPDFDGKQPYETLFRSRSQHVQTIALDHDGKLLAGTGPGGTLFRVTGSDSAFALFHSGADEIRGILPQADGSIFFHTFGDGSSGSANSAPTPPQPPRPGNNSGSNQSSPGNSNAGNAQTVLFKIDPQGFVYPWWAHPQFAIFSLLNHAEHGWLVGTGANQGLIQIEDSTTWGSFQRLPGGGEVTRLHQQGEVTWIITSNPGRIYRLGPPLPAAEPEPAEETQEEPREEEAGEAQEEAPEVKDDAPEPETAADKPTPAEPKGTFTGTVINAEQIARWGRLYALNERAERLPASQIETRSGNTERPDDTWSPWTPLREDFASDSPPARFLQYRITFTATSGGLRRVQAFYRLRNAAPQIQGIVMLPVGLEMMTARANVPSFGLEQFLTGAAREQLSLERPTRQQLTVERTEGAITLGWRASDPNGDRLQFQVDLRHVAEDTWTTLARALRDPIHTFDVRGIREGFYEVRITADDALDNDPDTALRTSRISSPFLIDTTPPTITFNGLQTEGRTAILDLEVSDSLGVIQAVFTTLNGGESKLAMPIDGLYDARTERFSLTFPNLDPGPQSIIIEAYDENNNRGIRHFNFTIED